MAQSCDQHGNVLKELEGHETRIHDLEISNATMGVKLEGLTDSVKDLVGWLKALVLSLLGIGVGLIIWYIQSL